MNRSKRNREPFAEHSYWQSYSDMMAALLLLFILIIAITLAIYKQKTTDLDMTREELMQMQGNLSITQKELDDTLANLIIAQGELDKAQAELDKAQADLDEYKIAIDLSNKELADKVAELQLAYNAAALTKDELDKAYLEIEHAQNELAGTKKELQDLVGVRTEIITALQTAFNNTGMSVDAQTGSMTFSADLMFAYNSSLLNEDSKKSLQEIIPKYLGVLLQDQYREYIAEIIIEGHTDTDGGYAGNMELSYNRAAAVARFCLDETNGLAENEILKLQELLTVNGKSCSQPIYETDAQGNATETIDMAASRRVEIKFRLIEDEMIKKIQDILNQS